LVVVDHSQDALPNLVALVDGWILVSSWARMGRAKIRAIRTDDANHGILLSVSLDINPETTKNRNGA